MELKRKIPMRTAAFLLFALLFLAACGNQDYSPKPRGYFRIAFPERGYRAYTDACPFTFQYPVYANMEADKNANAKPCWINMEFPQFNGTLHLSYEPITSKQRFDELVEAAHKFAFKHTVKATSIDEAYISYPDRKVYGLYYTIDGNAAASSVQFFVTDSVNHYLRGALYFNSEPRIDSIQPVLDFVKQDVDKMIKTLEWK
ncbi:MAG: gliding motility lipoprotein GldD [Sphingobacteriaceae bacterium]|nr:MAG: gliding motility lipoprotein GldD [Sphingobacteriaceae bacterium]